MFCCKDTTDYASDYLEGGLDGALGWRFRLHLLICRNCRRYLTQLRRTIALVGHLPAERLPTDTEAWLVEAYRRLHPAPPDHPVHHA